MAERKKQLPSLSSRSAAMPRENEEDKEDTMAGSKELTAAFGAPDAISTKYQCYGATATTDETTFVAAKRSMLDDGLKKSHTIAHHQNFSSVDAAS